MKNLIFLCILFVFGCNNNCEEYLNGFFLELEKEICAENLCDIFVSSDPEIFLLDNDWLNEMFDNKFVDLANQHESEIRLFLKNSGIAENSELAKIYLIVLFHNYLSSNECFEKKSLKITKRIVNNRRLKLSYVEDYNNYQIEKIIDLYSQKYDKGDTMTLILPLEYESRDKIYRVYHNAYPYSMDYSHASDTLFLNGIITNIMGVNEPESSIVYQLKILKNSHPNIVIFDKPYAENDTFTIDIRDYAQFPYK